MASCGPNDLEAEITERLEEVRRSHRSHIEMRAAILRAIRSESCRTRIMRRANVTWNLLNQSLWGMACKGLISERIIDGRKSYSLTPRGNEVLILFDRVRQELGEATDAVAWTVDEDWIWRDRYRAELTPADQAEATRT